jgi:hypothetical protein
MWGGKGGEPVSQAGGRGGPIPPKDDSTRDTVHELRQKDQITAQRSSRPEALRECLRTPHCTGWYQVSRREGEGGRDHRPNLIIKKNIV